MTNVYTDVVEMEELRQPKIPKIKCEENSKLDLKQERMRVWTGFKWLKKEINSHKSFHLEITNKMRPYVRIYYFNVY